MTGCLEEVGPAPTIGDITIHHNDENKLCDLNWEFCIDQASANVLAKYLVEVERYIRDTQTRCGTNNEPGGDDNEIQGDED